MRPLTLVILAITCSLSLSSCGVMAQQVRNARNLLTLPFRVELDIRFIDRIPPLERESKVAVFG